MCSARSMACATNAIRSEFVQFYSQQEDSIQVVHSEFCALQLLLPGDGTKFHNHPFCESLKPESPRNIETSR
jgi:hypothetical protein